MRSAINRLRCTCFRMLLLMSVLQAKAQFLSQIDTITSPYLFGNLPVINNGHKWGVYDPADSCFTLICMYDGITEIGEDLAAATEYETYMPLNTNIPRYIYTGRFLLFSKNGPLHNRHFYFSKTIAYVSDFHYENLVKYFPSLYTPEVRFSNGLLTVSDDKGRVMFLNKKGEQAFTATYDLAGSFHNGLCTVGRTVIDSMKRRIQLYGIIDTSGKELIPLVYEGIGNVSFYGIQPWDTIPGYSEDVVPALQNGKWGFINLKNEVVLDFSYDHVEAVSCGAIVAKDKKYGLTDAAGNQLIPFLYEDLWEHPGGLGARLDGQSFPISKTGERIK